MREIAFWAAALATLACGCTSSQLSSPPSEQVAQKHNYTANSVHPLHIEFEFNGKGPLSASEGWSQEAMAPFFKAVAELQELILGLSHGGELNLTISVIIGARKPGVAASAGVTPPSIYQATPNCFHATKGEMIVSATIFNHGRYKFDRIVGVIKHEILHLLGIGGLFTISKKGKWYVSTRPLHDGNVRNRAKVYDEFTNGPYYHNPQSTRAIDAYNKMCGSNYPYLPLDLVAAHVYFSSNGTNRIDVNNEPVLELREEISTIGTTITPVTLALLEDLCFQVDHSYEKNIDCVVNAR